MERVIQDLLLSETSYQRAINLPQEQFGQKQVLILSIPHVDAMLKTLAAAGDKHCQETEVFW